MRFEDLIKVHDTGHEADRWSTGLSLLINPFFSLFIQNNFI